MSKNFLLLLLAVLLLAGCGRNAAEPAPLPTLAPVAAPDGPPAEGVRTFVIVPDQSEALYLVDEEFLEDALSKLGINAGNVVVTGRTQAVSGELALTLDDLPASPFGRFQVDLRTLRTDQASRDKWIRENGPRFNQYPSAEFVATRAEGLPASVADGEEVRFTLHGEMTIREQTSPAAFAVRAVLNGDTLSGSAETNLTMTQFGIDPPSFLRTLTVADPFRVVVNFTAVSK
jgi:polyisoprenoid-binding protein YceI